MLLTISEPLNLKFVIKENGGDKEHIENFIRTITDKLIAKMKRDSPNKKEDANFIDNGGTNNSNEMSNNSEMASSITMVTLGGSWDSKTSNINNYCSSKSGDSKGNSSDSEKPGVLKLNSEESDAKSENSETREYTNTGENKIDVTPDLIEKLAKLFLKVKEYSENNTQSISEYTRDTDSEKDGKYGYKEFIKSELFISGLDIITTIKNHYGRIIKDFKSDSPMIKGIVVHQKGGMFTDYWGILRFKKDLIDESGIFEGVPSEAKGILSSTGFYKISNLNDDEEYTYLKKLIEKLAESIGMDIYKLFGENKKLSMIDRLIFGRNYVDRQNCHYVCECSDYKCEKPCVKIRCIKKS